MEQLVILLVIGAAGLIKWALEKSAEQRSKRDTEERLGRLRDSEPVAGPIAAPRPAFDYPDPDQAARRLREALGLPAEADLPPRRPMAAPPTPSTFQVHEVKVVPAIDLERRIVKEVLPSLPKKKSKRPAAPREAQPTAATASSSLNDLLRSRDGLRKAILVQEILGTPKGLVF